MAEAVVEDRPQQPQKKFFCHRCNVEIDNVSPEYTCPLCTGGFIEELPSSVERRASVDVEMSDDQHYYDLNSRLTDEISSLLMSVTGALPVEGDDDQAPQLVVADGSTGRRAGGRRSRYVHNLHNIDNVLQDFLVSITGSGAAGPPMFFMGNPADYVYGRDGLDTIVTQLLNQLDGTGPPPLPKDKIAEIPKVYVTDEQVHSKLQCSICWEDFQLQETVRQLPCVHIYHENCIVPWLELHGTCPVCRKTLTNDNPEEQQQAAVAGVANSLRNVAAMYRTDSEASSSNNISDGNRPNRRQTRSATRRQQPSQNDRMRDDDGNIEYDFD